MPVEELLARLSDRFRVLGTARTATDRHRTLRAAVAWSYELCTPAEQRLWAELSVFPGGFGLRGGRARLRARHRRDAAPPRRQVGRPVSRGSSRRRRTRRPLPAARHDAGVRRGAPERGGPAVAARVRARHRDYYLGLAEQAAAGSMTAGQTAWLNRLERGDREPAGRARLLVHRARRGAARPADDPRAAALLADDRPVHRGQALARPGVSRSRPRSRDDAWAVFGAGVLAVQQGDFAAGGPLLARATELARAAADEDLAAHVTDARGMLAFYSGDLPAAQAEFESALAVDERAGLQRPDGAGHLQPARVGLPADLRARPGGQALRGVPAALRRARRAVGARHGAVDARRGPLAVRRQRRRDRGRARLPADQGAARRPAHDRDVLRPAVGLPGGDRRLRAHRGAARGQRAPVDAAERAGAHGARLRRDPQERRRHRARRARRGALRRPGGPRLRPAAVGRAGGGAGRGTVPGPRRRRRARAPGRSRSPGASGRSPAWSPTASATGRSPSSSTCPSGRSTPTWSTSSPSSASPPGPSSPPGSWSAAKAPEPVSPQHPN